MNSVVQRISAEALDKESFFRDFVVGNTPVIVEGAIPVATGALAWTSMTCDVSQRENARVLVACPWLC